MNEQKDKTAPVDVLAVMNHIERLAELRKWSYADQESIAAARAAIAELIEASTQLVALDDCEAPCDPACIHCRLRAALAAVGGAK